MISTMEKVTIEKLQSFGSTCEAIGWAMKQRPEFPKRPTKPFLKNGASSLEAKIYAEELGKWESYMDDHKKIMDSFYKECNEIYFVIEDFIKDQVGLDTIPEQYRSKVWSKAYEDGHSSGFYEVYLKLESLVAIFD